MRYSAKTYLSLLPLTIGVILACSSDMSLSNAMGLLCAFGSALIFVSSNIFFKKVVPSNSTVSSHKLDKLNLLFYSSSMAFVLMIPIWICYDLPALLALVNDPTHVVHPNHDQGHHSVVWAFFANGTVHFAQNIIAFILLAQTSPVTYSIASLIKRVAVICIAIVWFSQPVHVLQGFGIALTFGGLYMYNQAKSDVEQGERAVRRVAAARNLELPSNRGELMPASTPAPVASVNMPIGIASGYGRSHAVPTTTAAPQHKSAFAPPPHIPAYTQPRPASGRIPPPPTSYSQTHETPNLRIKVTPASTDEKPGAQGTPFELYPSPPPSLDSPPPGTDGAAPWPAPQTQARPQRRGSMTTGHSAPRHYDPTPVGRATVVS